MPGLTWNRSGMVNGHGYEYFQPVINEQKIKNKRYPRIPRIDIRSVPGKFGGSSMFRNGSGTMFLFWFQSI